MDNLPIGKIITGEQKRDAIHVAVAPVVAAKRLYPGQHIGVAEGVAVDVPPFLGIVDPFLDGPVFPEQRFWLFLFPGSITSLRHHWEHPALREDEPAVAAASDATRAASERWLRYFVERSNCPDYDAVIAAASGGGSENVEDDDGYSYHNDGKYLYFGGRDAHGEIPPEFWGHVENVTGLRIGPDKRPESFSCSC